MDLMECLAPEEIGEVGDLVETRPRERIWSCDGEFLDFIMLKIGCGLSSPYQRSDSQS